MTDLLKHILRCCLFIFLQVFLLNVIPPLHRYVSPHLYYLFILWLPFRTPRIALLLIAFFYGLILDAFLHTPGLHAAACTLIAYLRPFIISLLLPKEVGETGYPEPSYEERTAFLIPFLQEKEETYFMDFLTQVRKESSGLVDFIVRLTRVIYQEWKHEIRHEENIWDSTYTFEQKKGSCRDLALMEMDMLREIGLATRFVSGYAFNPDLEDGHELHAWLEVFLPGAGWVGVDPSLGLFTDQSYIPLASHPDPKRTLPVQGSYIGSATSQLVTRVDVKLLHK